MQPIIEISNLNKTYDKGLKALESVSFAIEKGEILALLGPNGAGKTTLISMVCGLTTISSGTITVGGFDVTKHPRQARRHIGLVPQELTLNMFESVWDTVIFSRGLFGLPTDNAYITQLLKTLSLWDKRSEKLMALSGGMKRRVMIAKALAHEPTVLFLDEPSSGVDVKLRQGMWQQIRNLRESGVTIILTTHYIEEAEKMADRIGVINHGKVILLEEKNKLMRQLGKKVLRFELTNPIQSLPASLSEFNLELNQSYIEFRYSSTQHDLSIPDLIDAMKEAGIVYKDIQTKQSNLEDIFVGLVQS